VHHHAGHVHVEIEFDHADIHEFAAARFAELDENVVHRMLQSALRMNEIDRQVLHLLRGERRAGHLSATTAVAEFLPQKESDHARSHEEEHDEQPTT